MTSIVVKRVLSSVYIMNSNKVLQIAVSFTYITKSKWPRMNIQGILVATANISNQTSLSSKYCFLFVR